MTKTVKIIIALMIILMLANFFSTPKTYALAEMIEAADSFPSQGADSGVNEANLRDVSRSIFYPFLAVAVAVAVIFGGVIGIKIMIGTIEEKAKMKEMLVPYIVGLVVIFGAFTIWSTVVKIGTSVIGDGHSDSRPPVTDDDEDEESTYGIVHTHTYLYSSPDDSSSYFVEIQAGTRVRITDTTGEWYRVQIPRQPHGSYGGYVKISFVTLEP